MDEAEAEIGDEEAGILNWIRIIDPMDGKTVVAKSVGPGRVLCLKGILRSERNDWARIALAKQQLVVTNLCLYSRMESRRERIFASWHRLRAI
jgi:hypothetical protein